MKIGIALLQVEEGVSGGIAPLLQGVLAALGREWPEHEITLFCTPTNRRLFESGSASMHVWDQYAVTSEAAHQNLWVRVHAVEAGLRRQQVVRNLLRPIKRAVFRLIGKDKPTEAA